MAKELKRCPFCGGKANIYRVTGFSAYGTYYVMCDECLTSGNNYVAERNAREAWNTRRLYGEIDLLGEVNNEGKTN